MLADRSLYNVGKQSSSAIWTYPMLALQPSSSTDGTGVAVLQPQPDVDHAWKWIQMEVWKAATTTRPVATPAPIDNTPVDDTLRNAAFYATSTGTGGAACGQLRQALQTQNNDFDGGFLPVDARGRSLCPVDAPGGDTVDVRFCSGHGSQAVALLRLDSPTTGALGLRFRIEVARLTARPQAAACGLRPPQTAAAPVWMKKYLVGTDDGRVVLTADGAGDRALWMMAGRSLYNVGAAIVPPPTHATLYPVMALQPAGDDDGTLTLRPQLQVERAWRMVDMVSWKTLRAQPQTAEQLRGAAFTSASNGSGGGCRLLPVVAGRAVAHGRQHQGRIPAHRREPPVPVCGRCDGRAAVPGRRGH